MDPAVEDVRRLDARLCEQAFLFDDPDIYIAGVKDALAAVMRLPTAPPESVCARLARASRPNDHLVEFYESDEFLVSSVVQFLAPSLRAGEAAIVVATRRRRDKFEAALAAEGLDVAGVRRRGQLIALDAAQTLAMFMVDGRPDPARFRTVVGELIDRVAESGRDVRVYGEMVALLWEKGNISAAVSLEDLWNELADSRHFSLLCAYRMSAFNRQESTAAFRTVCHRHSAVIPSESYSNLSDPDDRLRAVALLQQEATAGSHERTALRRKQNELEAARDRARDLDRRIEFVAMMVNDLATKMHDIRTPVVVIAESLGVLRDSWSKLDEDHTQELLTKAIENGQQIERLAGDLLLALSFGHFLLDGGNSKPSSNAQQSDSLPKGLWCC